MRDVIRGDLVCLDDVCRVDRRHRGGTRVDAHIRRMAQRRACRARYDAHVVVADWPSEQGGARLGRVLAGRVRPVLPRSQLPGLPSSTNAAQNTGSA
jgi:hypothetical protein